MHQEEPPERPAEILGRVVEIHRSKKVLTPKTKLGLMDRVTARLLSQRGSFVRLALRIHSGGDNLECSMSLQPAPASGSSIAPL
jgi:hypothetical protein